MDCSKTSGIISDEKNASIGLRPEHTTEAGYQKHLSPWDSPTEHRLVILETKYKSPGKQSKIGATDNIFS